MLLTRLKYLTLFLLILPAAVIVAESKNLWAPQSRVPGYRDDTDPPLLIADQNRVVHAFAYQQLVDDESEKMVGIIYSQWSVKEGWTYPIDVLLSPAKNDARVLSVFLDQNGVVHLIFFAGDETAADLYYAKAPAVHAGRATAWSRPKLIGAAAADPAEGAILVDDQNNLVVLYSGRAQGRGVYAIFSADDGETWSNPTPIFLTYSENLFPSSLKAILGDSGYIHTVWDIRDRGGNGRQIIYSRFDPAASEWAEPVILASAPTGYGVLNPTVVEYRQEIIVAYSGVSFRRSADFGETWTSPLKPFPHVGVNGQMSFVEDGSGQLHFFWAQRITGVPDIHGAWHSRYESGRWSTPEAIISGPTVEDLIGENAFDPYDVNAVISQGNVILVTWRTDPGNKGNGVWYSFLRSEAAELPFASLPEPSSAGELTVPPEENLIAVPVPDDETVDLPDDFNRTRPITSAVNQSPVEPVLISMAMVVLLLLVVFGWSVYFNYARSRQ